MLGFLLPKLAWLSLFALAPIVIHLLNRIRLRRVDFSSLRFLRDVKRERFNWLRLKELLQLRDAGAGEVISYKPRDIGLGDYVIRFTFADGQTVDLKAYYPPAPRSQREAIFAETRQLKAKHLFSVSELGKSIPGSLWATLTYTLSDGRRTQRSTGTDANVIQITRAGVAAGLVSIPTRYIHTQVEVASLRDMVNAARLLAETVARLDGKLDFTPR